MQLYPVSEKCQKLEEKLRGSGPTLLHIYIFFEGSTSQTVSYPEIFLQPNPHYKNLLP
jgi:hypothetical protein